MLRQIIVIFVWLLGFCQPVAEARDLPLANQAPAQEAAETQVRQASRQGALFRIRDAGHTLFLFGTIHVAKPDFYPLEPMVLRALEQSSKLALEIDPADTQKAQQALRQHGFYQQLPPQLEPALQARLESVLKRQNLPAAAVAQMKPWMLVVVLALNEYAAQGYQSDLAVDGHLARLARAQNKPVVALESADEQIALFAGLSMPDQVRMLEETLTDIENGSAQSRVRRIMRLWREADADGLEDLSKEMARDQTFAGRFLQRVLRDGRNPSLANGVEKLLKSEKHSLAGIGLLHLVGAGSVPELLRSRGYQVERMY